MSGIGDLLGGLLGKSGSAGIESVLSGLMKGGGGGKGMAALLPVMSGLLANGGLNKILADRLRLPVELASPLERLRVGDNVFDTMNIDEVSPLLMLPIGLALRTAA